ncbi:DNA (cytosine-5-)-methyltransferase [Rhizobium ruizarguesonis]|uniref:DNA (cytosine-5-)-methyltransferase n=3 Tax=Rhizobium ruizarguesonis TaxID=2081791 RepID=A0AB38HRJ7_9HYPH|nr:DNA (cytosine-5-)-methyltransferase [Rhizobium ruizarguesonis]TBB70587.1 DNA (cytosine-5-)-methyltransferase [Rhizobium ruizarguesonis]TBC01916.1 DNA (cytosine-5-)-methyltransferase [Rhizobium ruizarguesonis]
MDDIDAKAQALSAARNRILKLQEQMTDKVLQMAAEVETLMDVVPAPEARAFLKARCNLPATELSTYVGFAKTLKGSEDVLRAARVSFPVVKALVSSDDDARREILERMEIGAQIDTKDVASIRRRLAAAKLTAAEASTAENRRIVAAAARKQAKEAISGYEAKISAFIEELKLHFRKGQANGVVVQTGLRHQAGRLLEEFESLFGGEQPPLASLRPASPQYRIAHAHKVLGDVATGRLLEIGPMQTSALQAFAGRARVSFDPRPRKPLADLASLSFRPRVLELCAGAGGLALGLERAGFEHVALIEFNKHAAATLRRNRPDWNVVEEDVRKVDFTPYRNRVDLLAGGLPCTPFTTVGEKKGKRDENDLLMEGVRAVREVKPKAFVFENVEGLLHARHADYVATLLRGLSKAGYQTEIHRINTRDYGVAQDRSRIMIVGFRKDAAGIFRMPPKFPEMARNMGDVLADLMGASGWNGAEDWVRMMRKRPEFDRFGNPIGVGALSDTIRGYQGSPKEGEARRALENGVSYAPPAKVAPTNDEASREGFVPGLTNRMRARLQDFPDDWKFVGGMGSVADQIGNAVAPAVGQAMGLALVSALKEWEIDWHAMMERSIGLARRRIVSPPPIMADIAHFSELEDAD